MELVLATTNLHKIREFREMLKEIRELEIRSLIDFPHYIPPEETGKTFQENAKLKALSAAKALQKWVLADDSGLVVPALQGEPGVISARYSGPGATDASNRRKLLQKMSELQDLERAAYFECWLVLANSDGIYKSERGICEGMIVREERGTKGFGYDPIFMKHDYNQTFGELDENVKNRISHRSKAIEKMRSTLASLKNKYP
jgi:XTP/dITP diphosphohydrolase